MLKHKYTLSFDCTGSCDDGAGTASDDATGSCSDVEDTGVDGRGSFQMWKVRAPLWNPLVVQKVTCNYFQQNNH